MLTRPAEIMLGIILKSLVCLCAYQCNAPSPIPWGGVGQSGDSLLVISTMPLPLPEQELQQVLPQGRLTSGTGVGIHLTLGPPGNHDI